MRKDEDVDVRISILHEDSRECEHKARVRGATECCNIIYY
jgi:hypothetical protein